jgi:hypothetical protein
MKICKKCGGTRIQADIDPKYARISGHIYQQDDRVAELYKDNGLRLPGAGPAIGKAEIAFSPDFKADDMECFTNVRCANCGHKEFEEQIVCPRCAGRADELYYCHYEGQVVCAECRDGWTCRNDCRHNQCPLHPEYNGKDKPRDVPPWAEEEWIAEEVPGEEHNRIQERLEAVQ